MWDEEGRESEREREGMVIKAFTRKAFLCRWIFCSAVYALWQTYRQVPSYLIINNKPLSYPLNKRFPWDRKLCRERERERKRVSKESFVEIIREKNAETFAISHGNLSGLLLITLIVVFDLLLVAVALSRSFPHKVIKLMPST